MGALADFSAAALPALAIAMVMYIFFLLMRTRFPAVFEPRAVMALADIEKPSAKLPLGMFAWLRPLLMMPMSEVARTAGTEAAARLAFLGCVVKACGVLLGLGAIVAVPLYATADGTKEEIEILTLGNVGLRNWRCFLVALLCWPASIAVYFFIYQAVEQISTLKESEERTLCHYWRHTVLTKEVPKGSRSVDAVRSHFEEQVPGAVLHVQPIKDLGKQHEKNVKKYTKHWRAMQKAMVLEKLKPEKTPMTKDGFMGLLGKKVEAIPFHREKCDEFKGKIEARLAEYDTLEGWSAAFITFNSVSAATAALQASKSHKKWGCQPATHPREICWPNLVKARPKNQLLLRSVLVGMVVAFVIVAFVPFLAFSQSIANLEELAKEYSWLDWVMDIPAGIRGILQGLLPVVVVAVINALVVPVLEALVSVSGVENQRLFHCRTMWYVFFFLFFDSFIVVIAAGSLFNEMQAIVDDPGRLAEFLGVSLPVVSTFFMGFVVLKALGSAPGQLALLAKVVISQIKLKYLAKTDFERREALEPAYGEYRLGLHYAADLFIFVVCISYAGIAPLAVLVGLVYFVLNFVTTKYLLVYRWKSQFNSAGLLPANAFRCLLLGILIGQSVTLCCLSLKESLAAIFIVPLVIATFISILAFPRLIPRTERQDVDAELAKELDAKHQELGTQSKLQEVVEARLWVQPSAAVNFEDPVHDRFGWSDSAVGAAWAAKADEAAAAPAAPAADQGTDGAVEAEAQKPAPEAEQPATAAPSPAPAAAPPPSAVVPAETADAS